MDMSKRVTAEGISIFVKSVCMYLFITLFGDRMGLLAFALAQMVYCIILLFSYAFSFRHDNIKDIFTVKTLGDSMVLSEHKSDLKEFSLVCIVKFVLTEGQKIIIFAFRDFVSDTYQLINHIRILQCRQNSV